MTETDQWRWQWVEQRIRHSQHDRHFWEEVADVLLEGRNALRNNPLVPVDRYALQWPGALEMLVERNNRGIKFDKKGNLDAAIFVYEVSIGDEFSGTQPYDRLRVIYTKAAWYEDAIRVCEAYLTRHNRPHEQQRLHFQQHVERLNEKMVQSEKRTRLG